MEETRPQEKLAAGNFVGSSRRGNSIRPALSWNHWRMPVVIEEVGADVENGPVLVTVEYAALPKWTEEFVDAIAAWRQQSR